MDNLILPRTRPPGHQPLLTGENIEHHQSAGPTTTRFPSILSTDVIELRPSPPPRLPPRGERPSDADPSGGIQRPCPPPPPAPPLPVREPLRPVSPHRTTAPAPVGAPLTKTRRQPPDCGSPPLDQIVPLAHWPLPRVTLTAGSSTAPHGREKTHVLIEPLQSRVTTTNVSVASSSLISQQPKSSQISGNLYVDPPTLRRNCVGLLTANNATSATGGVTSLRQPESSVVDPAVSASSFVGNNRHLSPPTAVVTTQPTSKSERSAVTPSSVVVGGGGGKEKYSNGGEPLVCRGGIVCSRCSRCRCANCTAPRELPRRWIGDFECSMQRCVNVTTCLCCVQAIFYHCLDGSDEAYVDNGSGGGAADDPCACCEQPRCCVRWTVMTALATSVLPCLCCYCPMQCAMEALTTCYNACATPRGCRCQVHSQEVSSGGSTRGLLGESESSST